MKLLHRIAYVTREFFWQGKMPMVRATRWPGEAHVTVGIPNPDYICPYHTGILVTYVRAMTLGHCLLSFFLGGS